MSYNTTLTQIEIKAPVKEEYKNILTTEALAFLKELHIHFNLRRKELLAKRVERQSEIDKGILPDFLPETAEIRNGDWTIDPLPQDLQDRRVEITGPVDRKMIINALNSGAKMFMADFEDSNAPTWANVIEGQINLKDAINRNIDYTAPNGKVYKLNDEIATLLVRPRGWHLEEKNIGVDGEAMSASLVDFGLYFFHNAQTLIQKGKGPYFYLPKIESHLEARLWNDVFVFAQQYLNIPEGTIKATVLIETILASFELDEILYELRKHSAGLNCGRWDYIFSYIKKFRNLEGYILPDRSQVSMTTPFMRAYSLLVIKTCHKRNAPAIGGMSAFIPVKNDEAANKIAFEKVYQDKLREAKDGHDGTWVAHPGLVKIAMQIFDEIMPTPNQIFRKREDVNITAAELIAVPEGTITEEGVRMNINVGILYIESWLNGIGAAAIYNLMEDAATAEISRAQVWQWLKYKVVLTNGKILTKEFYQTLLEEEMDKIKQYVGKEKFEGGRFEEAKDLFNSLVFSENFEEFLTLGAYQLIN